MSTIECARRVPAAVRGVQLLSVLLALPMAAGSVLFGVITPDRHHPAWETWLFAPISFAIAVGLLATVPRLAGGETAARRMAGLLLAALTFSLVKLTAFHETESIPFLVLALAAYALLRRNREALAGHPRG